MRLPTYDTPRIIGCAEQHSHHISLPRGCLDDVRRLLSDLGIEAVVRDERYSGQPLQVMFQGELRPQQKIAAEATLAHETGVLAATTAFGKTVIAAWLIAQRGVNTLVLVHRRQLLDQWVERLSAFLNVPATAIGRIGGGQHKPTGLLDVAIIQSLVRNGVVDDRVGEYGHLIVDECHHLPAHSFEQVVRRAKARFITGLSATVARKDGHQPIVFMQCGPVRHRVSAKAQAATRPFEHIVAVVPGHARPNGHRVHRLEPPSELIPLGDIPCDNFRNRDLGCRRSLRRLGRRPPTARVQAILEACRVRLRPVLMTSIAFIMGVLPLVFSSGAGFEIRRAMGVAVFAGMLGVTSFGLFLTPVFYTFIGRVVERLRGRRAVPLLIEEVA